MRISRFHYWSGVGVMVAGLALNASLFRTPVLGAPLALGYGFLVSLALGIADRPREETADWSTLCRGAFRFFCAWTVAGAATYLLWRFPLSEIIALLAALAYLAGRWAFTGRGALVLTLPRFTDRLRAADLPAAAVGLIATLAASDILLRTSSAEAIRSPWEVLSPRFLPLTGVAAFAAAALAFRARGRRVAVALAAAVLGLGLSVAAHVYAIGFGFDPFIHEAAMRTIVEQGVVRPKTPYYVGEYVDLVPVARLVGVPLHAVNRVAGPFLGATTLAASAVLVGGAAAPLALLLAASGPLAHFVATTPQGIADALALLAATLAFLSLAGKRVALEALLAAVAAVAVHPIAGIPALGAVTLALLVDGPRKGRAAGAAVASLALVAFPIIAFLAQTRLAPELTVSGALARLAAVASALFPSPENWTFSPGRTLLYAWRMIFPLLVVLLAAVALRDRRTRRASLPLAIAAGTTALGGLLLAAFVDLPGIIAYEQAVFPSRFLSLAGILLFPTALAAALALAERLTATPVRRTAFALALALMVPAAIYLAYPRTDPEDRTGGRSVSASTVAAVDLVHSFGDRNAVVLANQTAAAAEIWRNGFSRYVDGEFWYSHPSGSLRLYGYFLRATDGTPSRALMAEVMDAYAVDTVYLMLHEYWKGFPRLVAEAEQTADAAWDIDGGKVMLFEYRR